ncbi:hypothetical protein [Anoxybacteroides tepidamans]|uniref:hypothetical protein n=1 Tax=Anoxybacteroides tepidamans TaxID=265948 RepID=UPI00048142F6|nr:hypothetical protein [Anoxybacillus tepidamans]
MQIFNDWSANLPANNEPVSSIKEGETVFATIKQKLNDHEAIVTIKGQDWHVRFQDNLPNTEKLAIQITGMHEGTLDVKAAAPKSPMLGVEGTVLAKIEQLLSKQGIRLTNEEKAALKRFIERAKGTMEEKLATIQALANKKLPMTDIHLQSVHETLHGEPLGDILTKIMEAGRFLSNDEAAKNKPRADQPADLTDSELPSPTDSKDVSSGDHFAAQWTYGNEEWFSGLSIQTKDIIVRTVSEKMARASDEFRQLQKEIGQKLENAQVLLANAQPQARQQGKMFIEAAIHTLDRAILQGQFMLFADMGTEKQLLQASAKLGEAKQLLAARKPNEALSIVQEVKKVVEALRFEPADVKVKHFVSELELNEQKTSASQQVAAQLERFFKAPSEPFSARNTFEQIRRLGMQHENELSQMSAKNEATPLKNMKSLLMSMAEGNEEAARQAEGAVANITGQQLLSKFEAKSSMQTMVYQLPLMMKDQIETVNVYLNSRNDDGKLDWQNCNLYFLFDTEKYGKIGLFLQAADRNLAITIKSDHPQMEEALKPLIEGTKENLQQIGYNVSKITFAPMNEQPASPTLSIKEANNEKGYDITI